MAPPLPAAPANRPGRPRLSPFERVQLLLVLWVALADPVRGGAGLSFLPVPAGADRIVAISAAVLLLRMVNAAAYPLLAFAISRRFPLWHRPARHAAVYAAALAVLHAAGWLMTRLEPALGFGWPFYLHRTFEFVVYAVFAHGMRYGERYHQKERDELRLRAVVAESTADRVRAQVRALRMEWSPRFLTGTLESIGALLARDAARAKRMLLGLSGVLRRTLVHARSDTVRLEQEVEFVREVLRLEALRRPGLDVDWKVDEGALELPVPHMSLVTLVYQALPEDVDAPVHLRLSAAATPAGVRLRVDAGGAAAERGEGGGEADATRLERLCEIDAAAPDDGERPPRGAADAEVAATNDVDAVDGVRGDARGEVGGEAPALGRRLETGTYAAFLVFYLLLTLYTADARVASGRAALAAPAWVYVAGSGVYAALWWGSLVTAARRLSARFPVRQARWPSRLAIHAGGAVLVALVNAVAYFPFQRYVVQSGVISIGFHSYWEWGDLTVYPLLAGIAHGFIYAREYHARRLSELRLRSQLSESELERGRAELQALKAELNPHFLFNALNTVSSLMHTRVDEARRVVDHLSALLQRMLESAGLHEVTVEEEVEFTRLYMEIEQARFGDALRMEYRVEPATRRARVPHLLVQPLVENAVKHGLRPRDGTGHVVLTTRREGGVLEVTVDDDGVGPGHAAGAEGTGTGLANVRQRLRQLYGDGHAFEVAAGPRGGTRARIRIPFAEGPRTAEPAGEVAGRRA